MQQTIIQLPPEINNAIEQLLVAQQSTIWITKAEELHHRYSTREKGKNQTYINDETDALAYLALRAPATYAQIFGALSQLEDAIPNWQPKSFLDIGSGPGSGIWAAKTIYPTISQAVCIDQERIFLSLGEKILSGSSLQINTQWQQTNLTQPLNVNESYDLVIIANVLNELTPPQSEKLIGQAFNSCSGVLLIVESGTPFGSNIVSSTAKKLAKAGNLLAPYVHKSFVPNTDYYLHFPQRFIRPEFERRVRQYMRESKLMASDWEEAKYSYTAIGKIELEKQIWGRTVGPIKIQKGFLEIPILTEESIETLKIMKRDKEKYNLTKKLHWGGIIKKKL